MRKINRWGMVLAFVVGSACRLWASAGTEGAAFLEIPVGAGPAALGGAYTALASDAYAPVWNPAGLGHLRGIEAAAQHLSYLESIQYEFASVVVPTKLIGGSLGASVQYLGTGDIAATDPTGADIGEVSAHYAAYNLAYGRKITDKVSVGVTGKLIEAKLAEVSGHALAGDLGAMAQVNSRLRLGAAVTNVGNRLKFLESGDSLPRAYQVGLAWQPAQAWQVSVDGVHQGGALNGRMGIQVEPHKAIALRAGYRTDTLKELSALAGFSTGVGIRAWGHELAYAWVPYGDLGDTQYFSLQMKFGADLDQKNLTPLQQAQRSLQMTEDDADYRQLVQLLDLDAK